MNKVANWLSSIPPSRGIALGLAAGALLASSLLVATATESPTVPTVCTMTFAADLPASPKL
jgi:hypothetical protein